MSLLPLEVLVEAAFILCIVIGVVLHEAGHLGAALAMGLHPRMLSVGRGPVVVRARIGRVLLVLRAVPVSGFVGIAAQPGMSRFRYAAMVAGGPMANAVLLGIVVLLDQVAPYYDLFLVPIAAGQAGLVLVALVPYRAAVRGGKRASDGLQLWRNLARVPPDMFAGQYAALAAGLFPQRPAWPPPSGQGPELVYHLARSDRATDSWAGADASDAVRRIAERGGLNPVERALALEFLAGNELVFGGTGPPPTSWMPGRARRMRWRRTAQPP